MEGCTLHPLTHWSYIASTYPLLIHCIRSTTGCPPWLAQLMDAWVRALAALGPQLERGVVKARIVPLALSKAQAHETSVQARQPPRARA